MNNLAPKHIKQLKIQRIPSKHSLTHQAEEPQTHKMKKSQREMAQLR